MLSFHRFLARRLALAVVTLVGVILTVFVLTFLLPGDIAALKLGQYATEDTLAAMRKEMGTDQPAVVQFVNYVKKLSRGDMGMSWVSGNPVRVDLGRRLPATLELGLAAIIIGILIGHVLGITAAVRQNTLLDEIVRGYAILGASTAVFWLALVLIYVFYFRLRWAPPPMGRLDLAIEVPPSITGLYVVDSLLAQDWTALRNSVAHLALPAVALGFIVSAPITKMVRAAMLDALHSDFIRTARAVGVPYRQVVLGDALRNAWIPILTSIGISFGYLLAGNVLVEQIFAWPGIGFYAWLSLTSKDFDALRGFILIVAVLYLLINLIIDLLYAVIDPRIRLG
jgi:peptide/nickel transport system permease protein